MTRPNFDQAIAHFDRFLIRNNLPLKKIWLFGRHSTYVKPGEYYAQPGEKGTFYLYFPHNNIREIEIKDWFDSCCTNLTFFAIAVHEGKTLCILLNGLPTFTAKPPLNSFENKQEWSLTFCYNEFYDNLAIVNSEYELQSIRVNAKARRTYIESFLDLQFGDNKHDFDNNHGYYNYIKRANSLPPVKERKKPDFEQAISYLNDFLRRNNLSQNKIWVLRRNTFWTKEKKLYLHLPKSPISEEQIFNLYHNHDVTSSNFVFYILAEYESRTICTILGDDFLADDGWGFEDLEGWGTLFCCSERWDDYLITTKDPSEFAAVRRKYFSRDMSNLDYQY